MNNNSPTDNNNNVAPTTDLNNNFVGQQPTTPAFTGVPTGGYFAPQGMYPAAPMYYPAQLAQGHPDMYWTPAGPMVPVPMHAPIYAPGQLAPNGGGYLYSPTPMMIPHQPIYMIPASPHGSMTGSSIGFNGATQQQDLPSPKPPTSDRQQSRTPEDALPAKLELARFNNDGASVHLPTMAPLTNIDSSYATLAGSMSHNNNPSASSHRSPGPPAPVQSHHHQSVLSHSDSTALTANDTSNSALLTSMVALPPPAGAFLHPAASTPTGRYQQQHFSGSQRGGPNVRGGSTAGRSAAVGQPHGQLMVCYLDVRVNAQELSSLFSPHGQLNGAKIVYDNNNQSRCYGFVYFCRHEDACAAVAAMDGFRHRGKNLRVHFSERPNAVFSQQRQ
ncbi:RNA-binding protein, putative [Bodo saltans]|uniref:RNA-binding protein, putative n=1 Tax=Bodo saltans TaxID=75058 RepID=A0A0S4IPG8_BODSA|nr:RNA-binding protein, putative [Bodo saltans]|eukprot:CUF05718.1 RNA-binding protein, putative [Bodo saltans]